MMAKEIITDKTISPVFQGGINPGGWVDFRAYEIKQELARVGRPAELLGFFLFPAVCKIMNNRELANLQKCIDAQNNLWRSG